MVNQFLDEIREAAQAPGPYELSLLDALDRTLTHFDCKVGTIHRFDPANAMLNLVVQRGLPEMLLDRVSMIPIGKGMAGLAAERRAPVQVCNLQTDASGQAKPAAKETKMEGSISFPMLASGELRGAMGVAKPVPYEFTDEETSLLLNIGEILAERL